MWDGNYYAVEIMKRLGLPDGAVRIGIVHYNTADEVDRLLDELAAWTDLRGRRCRGGLQRNARGEEIPVGSRRPDQRDADRQAAAAADTRRQGDDRQARPVPVCVSEISATSVNASS